MDYWGPTGVDQKSVGTQRLKGHDRSLVMEAQWLCKAGGRCFPPFSHWMNITRIQRAKELEQYSLERSTSLAKLWVNKYRERI